MVEAVYPPEPRTDDPHASVRAIELTRLRARLESPDQGGTVLLRGPRGVGKEHLASELVTVARTLQRTAVFEGRTPPAGGRSFHPFAELVRQAMTWAEQARLSDLLVDPLLSDLGPVLDADAADASPAPSLDQKLRFFEAVRRLLTGVSERARMLAVVHDLERADGDTLELAGYLADNLFADPALEPGSGRPGMLLLVVRDDRSTTPRVRDFLADLDERRTVETLRLSGLDLDGVRLYLQSPRVLEKVLAASEGIPREIDELFDALPSNVEQLFERRLDAMSHVERSVLRALALSSRSASARVLSTVTSLPLKDVAVALASHKDARILERKITNGELVFSFARRSNLEVTARTGRPDELAQLHAGWATALAESGASDPALLAHHQLRSTEPARGVPLAIRAAETHAVAGAFDATASLLEDALPHARGELRLTALARLSELASLRAKPREAVRWVELWKAELPEHDRGRALIREAELHNAVGDYDRALASLAEARPSLDASQVLERASVESAEAEALYQRGKLDEATAAAERGLALVGDEPLDGLERTRIELVNLLGKVAVAREDYAAANARFRQTFTAAERAGLAREAARALVNIGHAALRAGDHSAAERTLLEAVDSARAAHDLSHLAIATLNLGVIAHVRSQLGQAIEHYRTCRSLFARLGNRTQLARVLANLATLYSTLGDLPRARAHVSEALRLARATGSDHVLHNARVVEGTLLAREGQREEAEAILRDAMVQQRRLGAERSTETLIELADIQLSAHDLVAARETIAELAQSLDQVRTPRLALRARAQRARLMVVARDGGAVDALEAVRGEIERSGDRLLAIEVEEALMVAYEQRGHRERARVIAASVEQLRRAVAHDLPAELRESFLSRSTPSVTLDRALDAPVMAEVSAPAAPARPSAPPGPVARSSDWDKKYASIVGRSPKLHRVFHILDRVSQSDSTVLIVGESGTGKELVAEAIHKTSPRSRGPFVKLNCAALVESLLLSELFGHERGAFTGAHQRKAGRFEMAAGGTIFLDEIGDISPKTQVSLLRVLQAREFERVGGGRPIKLEARVVCATNRNLAQMVRDGTFREDLYYRLKGLAVDLPPLRDRPEDIESLAGSFLERYALESGSAAKVLSREAVAMMARYAWPGNIRELENVVRSVALFADTPVIAPHHFDEYRELFEDSPAFGGPPVVEAEAPRVESLPVRAAVEPPRALESLRAPAPVVVPAPSAADEARTAADNDASMLSPIFHGGVPLAELKKKIQAEAIARALKLSRGNITKAAEILGMKRPRLSQIINANDELKALCLGVGR